MLTQVVSQSKISIHRTSYGDGCHERIWWEEQIHSRYIIALKYYMNLRGVGPAIGTAIERYRVERTR